MSVGHTAKALSCLLCLNLFGCEGRERETYLLGGGSSTTLPSTPQPSTGGEDLGTSASATTEVDTPDQIASNQTPTVTPQATIDPSIKSFVSGRAPFALKSLDQLNSNGPYSTTTTDAGSTLIYYPVDVVPGYTHPVISWGNPTNYDSIFFSALLHRLASHGFVITASHSVATGSGEDQLDALGVLSKLNAQAGHPLYQRLNMNLVGTLGHSQGGKGSIAAASADSRIKTVVSLHPYLANSGQLRVPMLLTTAAGDTTSTPSHVKSTAFDVTPAPVVYGVLKLGTHYSPVSLLGGSPTTNFYVLAWFRLFLMADADMSSLFFGTSCRICSDQQWQVLRKNL